MKDTRKFNFNKFAILFTILSCGLITVLRIALTPSLFNEDTNRFENSTLVITITIISFILIAVFNFLGKKEVISLNKVRRKQGLLVVATSIVFGIGLLAATIYDSCMWFINRTIPPPVQIEIGKDKQINSFNRVLIYAVFILGVLAALFMIWFALNLSNRSVTKDNALALGLLLPVGWMWFRVIRYVVSYASAVRVNESFYDFMMIIFSLLFLFFLARNISGIGKSRTMTLMTCGMLTFLLTFSSFVSRSVLLLKGEEQSALAGNLTGVPDLLLGFFALAVVIAFAYNKAEASTHEELVEIKEDDSVTESESEIVAE